MAGVFVLEAIGKHFVLVCVQVLPTTQLEVETGRARVPQEFSSCSVLDLTQLEVETERARVLQAFSSCPARDLTQLEVETGRARVLQAFSSCSVRDLTQLEVETDRARVLQAFSTCPARALTQTCRDRESTCTPSFQLMLCAGLHTVLQCESRDLLHRSPFLLIGPLRANDTPVGSGACGTGSDECNQSWSELPLGPRYLTLFALFLTAVELVAGVNHLAAFGQLPFA